MVAYLFRREYSVWSRKTTKKEGKYRKKERERGMRITNRYMVYVDIAGERMLMN